MNKTAFVISVVLTTFVLMAFGGIVYALRASDAAPATESVQQNSVELVSTEDPSLEQTLLEREAIYQQRIAEANARLEQAQQQLAAQTALVSPQANGQAAVTQITAEQAAQIAADFLGQSSVYWVEIVTVKGEDLYMVTFTTGEAVYVNLAGQVVGSAPAQYSGGGGGGGGGLQIVSTVSNGSDHDDGNEENHESEHEGDDHESGGGDD